MGTITDTATGLTWLKHANCPGGTKNFADALTFSNSLAAGSCGLTDGSTAGTWRLPNRSELASLFNYAATSSSANPAWPFCSARCRERFVADPAKFLAKFKNRAPMIHCKDMDKTDGSFAEVGHGSFDWDAILKGLKESLEIAVLASRIRDASRQRIAAQASGEITE